MLSLVCMNDLIIEMYEVLLNYFSHLSAYIFGQDRAWNAYEFISIPS